jgi:hypothetical protein
VPAAGARNSAEAALNQPLSGGGGPDGRDYDIPDKAFAKAFAKLRVAAIARTLSQLGLPTLPPTAAFAYSCAVQYEGAAAAAGNGSAAAAGSVGRAEPAGGSTAAAAAAAAEKDEAPGSIVVCKWPSTVSGEAEDRAEAGFAVVVQFERAWKAQVGALRGAQRLIVASLTAEVTVLPPEVCTFLA